MMHRSNVSYTGTKLNKLAGGILILLASFVVAHAADSVLYQNDFEKAEIGKVPDGMQVVDGNFTVKSDGTNKFLELPGAPLDSFSVQFGPSETNALSVSAAIHSASKTRRYPTFGIGLYGIAGFKLQVTPAKKSLELFKDQMLLATAEFDWKSGEWTELRLQAHAAENGSWKIEGKSWARGSSEPSKWMISADYKPDFPLSGPGTLFGSPFSGMPIQYDDLKISAARD